MDGAAKTSRFSTVTRSLTLSLMASIAILSSGCAHKNGSTKPGGGAIGNLIRESDGNGATASSHFFELPGAEIFTFEEEVLGVKPAVTKYDFPMRKNPAVEKWVAYFTGKGRKYFTKYLERGRYFIPEISKILRQNNMPQDLVYLAMIESGFNNVARSHAKAVGPWQFMRFTGIRYGLTVNYWIDERRDTRRATMAAIAYLRELYKEFGSWECAAAGYNAGEGKIRRAISKYKTRDFWEMTSGKRHFLRAETRNYVPKIIAAALIAKNPELYGFEDPFKRGNAVNPTGLLLAEGTESDLKEEPTPKELAEVIDKADKNDDSDDPAEKTDATSRLAAEEEDEDDATDEGDELDHNTHVVLSRSAQPTISPSVYMVANPSEQILEFEVKGPADLFAIAKAAGLPYSTLKLLNPELLRWVTPPYMKTYKIKLPLSSKSRFMAAYNDENFDRKVVFQSYKVKGGDNVQTIAKRNRVESDAIREINGLAAKSVYLKTGSEILLPIPTGYKRVIASMYDEPLSSPRKAKRRKSRRGRRRASTAAYEQPVRSSALYKPARVRLAPRYTSSNTTK